MSDIEVRPAAAQPAEVREPMARVEYYSDGHHGPAVRRLDQGEEQWNWFREVPEQLLAAYEEAKAVFDVAEAALVAWVDENKPEEIEPTWERK